MHASSEAGPTVFGGTYSRVSERGVVAAQACEKERAAVHRKAGNGAAGLGSSRDGERRERGWQPKQRGLFSPLPRARGCREGGSARAPATAGRFPAATRTEAPAMAKHVFLTGPPGIGKTTLIQKATEVLKSSGIPIDGFYTEEVREGGRRIGFDVVTLSGRRGILSRVGSGPSTARREYRVGQYVVDLMSFEQLALPLLRNPDLASSTAKKVCIIDEIGKMELFSQSFTQAVHQILTGSGTVILGTIPVPKGKPLGLVEEIRSRKEVKVFNITKENRDSILQDIVAAVQSCLK
ncbi:cancer-related nucleoside-triphosphatase [Podarcis raffonei]|uniref:cancer-related nucleoside-triphosphatase n=1 Tax=Podarcis raffonei TaxID=65483 RepID=UPI0023290E8A|nr:cancer-related nucleoside-triphosphatase [Podarcis raffonei]